MIVAGGRQLSRDGTSRVTGDSHARFCERLGVKFPGPTRRRSATVIPTATGIRVLRFGLVLTSPTSAVSEALQQINGSGAVNAGCRSVFDTAT
jgi:hypothetical protein